MGREGDGEGGRGGGGEGGMWGGRRGRILAKKLISFWVPFVITSCRRLPAPFGLDLVGVLPELFGCKLVGVPGGEKNV